MGDVAWLWVFAAVVGSILAMVLSPRGPKFAFVRGCETCEGTGEVHMPPTIPSNGPGARLRCYECSGTGRAQDA